MKSTCSLTLRVPLFWGIRTFPHNYQSRCNRKYARMWLQTPIGLPPFVGREQKNVDFYFQISLKTLPHFRLISAFANAHRCCILQFSVQSGKFDCHQHTASGSAAYVSVKTFRMRSICARWFQRRNRKEFLSLSLFF